MDYATRYRARKAEEAHRLQRENLLHKILFSSGREAVAEAQRLRDEWILKYPDDDGIFEASECLEIVADGYAYEDRLEKDASD